MQIKEKDIKKPVVSSFTKKQESKALDEMFECYDVRVSVRQTEALD